MAKVERHRGISSNRSPSAIITPLASKSSRADFEQASAVKNPAFYEAIFGLLFSPCLTFKFVDESIY
jgi:hypothetical protein